MNLESVTFKLDDTFSDCSDGSYLARIKPGIFDFCCMPVLTVQLFKKSIAETAIEYVFLFGSRE